MGRLQLQQKAPQTIPEDRRRMESLCTTSKNNPVISLKKIPLSVSKVVQFLYTKR